MTITEFLLERIAESETCEHCKHPISQHIGQWCRVPTGAVNSEGAGLICCCEGADAKSHVATEGDAKRRIINDCLRAAFADRDSPTHYLATRTLKNLASAYDDHPDYQEEWRP